MEGTKEIKKEKKVGGCTGKGFDILGQPSPEVKKKGWERKRESMKLTKLWVKYGEMSLAEIKEIKKDMKKNPQNYTLDEALMLEYRRNKKFITDYLDRNVGKAPQAVDITTDGNRLNNIKVTIVDPSGEYGIKSDETTEVEH